jgi:transcriptional regulator with XRE-family HTH domain
MTLGERLRAAREAKSWTQNKLSKVSGIPSNSISQYEKDRVDPSFFAATCLADALCVSLDWLAGHKDDMEVSNDN